ncbi:MAG: preprotein translocase subunit SecG [Patescibacteria group bacterium]
MTVAIIQIIVGVILVVLIILQERSAGLSGLMGGDSIGFYQTRRGLEKIVFVSTIVFTVIFVGLAVYQLVYA